MTRSISAHAGQHRKRYAIIGVLVSCSLVAVACGGDDDDDAAPAESAPAVSAAETAAPVPTTSEPSSETSVPGVSATSAPSSETTAPGGEMPELVSSDPLEETKLIQPTVTPSGSSLDVWLPLDLGLFEKHGLEIDYVDTRGAQVVDQLVRGDFVFGWNTSAIIPPALENGLPLQMYGVDSLRPSSKFYVQPDIESFEDLQGKTIAISGRFGQPHLQTLRFFEAAGVEPEGVTFQETANANDIFSALVSGQVAGGAVPPPLGVLADKEGLKLLADGPSSEIEMLGLVIVGDPEWVAAHPNTAKAWLRAFIEGRWIIATDRERTNEVLANRLELDPSDPEDKALIDENYENISAFLTPVSELGSKVASMLPTIADDVEDPSVLGDIGRALPDRDLVQEIIDEGYLDKLEAVYGPLPG